MGRGETAHPAIRRQPFVRLPSPLCGPLFTLPALRGGQGGDEPRPLTFCSAAPGPLGLPTLALPMHGEGRNCPAGHPMALPALRTSIHPPRFAGRAGWGRTEASCVCLGCTEAFGPPPPGPPHEWGGEKLPIRPLVDNRSSGCPPRFADLYSPSPLAGRAGWGRTEASYVLLGCTGAFGPPHPGPPHEWGGEKLPHRSSDGPPRFADFYSPSPLCGEGRVGTNRGFLRLSRLY